jgi:hypothetical protein
VRGGSEAEVSLQAPEVAQAKVYRSSHRRVGALPGTKCVAPAIDVELLHHWTVKDEVRGSSVSRTENFPYLMPGVQQYLQCRDDDGHVLRQAASHLSSRRHLANGEAPAIEGLPSYLAAQDADLVIPGAPGGLDHRLDGLRVRWHDRQPIHLA